MQKLFGLLPSGCYNSYTMLQERISALDKQRLDDGEVSIADLIDKYFAYLFI